MKKQSGFTLIELMVVMAIIAILATAGLAAYTGYIKKARDTTRIANVTAINNIALGAVSVNGSAPSFVELSNAIYAANNNQMLVDPLSTSEACCTDAACTTKVKCAGSGYYVYSLCDSGTGFAISTGFESASNVPKYAADILPSNSYYDVWSCKTLSTTPGEFEAIIPEKV